ncbi:MAG: FAD-binding protein, partial [Planctomycetales bacterium]
IRARFPGITATCQKLGKEVATHRIPVRTGAHYFIGGVTVYAQGQTTLPGLWAAGEVTSSGLHGANRLASNSLLEGMVYGAHAGYGASQAASGIPDEFHGLPIQNQKVADPDEPLDLADIRNSLKSLMWRNAGVRRDREGLADALNTINRWCQYVLPCQFTDIEGWELQNMLTVAQLVITAALAREETRGVHQRTDFPETDDAQWRRHLQYARKD